MRGVGVRARLSNALNAEGKIAGDYVVYPNAYGIGNHVLYRATANGLEDFISFDRRPETPVVSYDIELSSAVSGLRLVANTLELLNGEGYPLLRVAPPSIVDAHGVTHPAALALSGCAFDSDPRVPWNRAVTAPSAKECRLRVQWDDTDVTYPALLDPTWSTTGSMAAARNSHSVSALQNGDVLAVGGSSGGSGLASAEIYSRAHGVWAATGSMLSARSAHSANELPDGSILVLGGYSLDGSSSETYDPATGVWSAAGAMPSARAAHASISLTDGRVLATGGINPSNNYSYDALAAIYDPFTRAWSPSATMASSRALHSLLRLADGRILAIGGSPSGGAATASCEIYDPGTNVWTATGSMATARYNAATTATQTGSVFVAGGYGGGFLSSVETYNPTTGTWTTRAPMQQARNGASATVAPDGSIIVAGGWSGTSFWNTTQTFDPTSMSWSSGPTMLSPRGGHGAIAHEGVLLTVGGRQGSTSYLATAELIDLNQPPPPDEVCTDHASGTVFVPRWQTAWPPAVAPYANLGASVKNNSAFTQWVHVEVRAAYQGRVHSLPVWSGALWPGALQSLNVRFQDIPIRSSAGAVRAELVVTGDSGDYYDVEIASSPLYVQFTGSSYTVFGEEEPTNAVLSNPTSFEEAANQIATQLELMTTSAVNNGQYLQISQSGGPPFWSPLTGLPRPGSQLGTHTVGADLTLSPQDVETLGNFNWSTDLEFVDPIFSTVKVCARWPTGPWADFVGPPYEPSSHAKAYVRRALIVTPPFPPEKDTWSGYLNADGCSPPLRLESATSYVLGLSTELKAGGAEVKVNDRPNGSVIHRTVVFKTGTIGVAPTSLSVGEVGKPRHATRAAAIASAVLRRQGARIPQNSYTVHANQACPNAPACASGASIFLGPNTDGTHNSQWRYVVGHEFGHAVQYRANAEPNGSAKYDAAGGGAICECGHVDDPTDRQHCLQSREFVPAASGEGFGHYFASLVFGSGFTYYKSFRDDSETVHAPPFTIPANTPVRWLETRCNEAERGVEWDWLTFQYSVSVAPNPTRLDDLLDIYRRACGGDCSASGTTPAPTFFTLRNAAMAKYGPQDARALDFEQRGLASGVNH